MKNLIKKLFVLLCVLTIIPMTVFAESSYTSMNLSDTLKSESITADLSNYSESSDKVTIYMFRGQGCGHCEEFLKYVADTLIPEYGNYFNFVSYEVWSDSKNSELMTSVANALDATDASGVPFIIIGDQYFVGYASSMDAKIETAIKNQYEATEKNDVVKSVLNGEEVVIAPKTTASTTTKTIGIISACVIGIAIIGGIIFITTKKEKNSITK